MSEETLPAGFGDMLKLPLVQALLGRRSRRFFMGAEIPDGVLAYKSRHEPVPLSELEKLLVVTACGGNTGWHHMIFRAELYAPHLSNYAGAASGRSFPSAAGFHTSKIFFTDDEGVYVLGQSRRARQRREERGWFAGPGRRAGRRAQAHSQDPRRPPRRAAEASLYGAAQHLGCQWPRNASGHPGRRFGAACSPRPLLLPAKWVRRAR